MGSWPMKFQESSDIYILSLLCTYCIIILEQMGILPNYCYKLCHKMGIQHVLCIQKLSLFGYTSLLISLKLSPTSPWVHFKILTILKKKKKKCAIIAFHYIVLAVNINQYHMVCHVLLNLISIFLITWSWKWSISSCVRHEKIMAFHIYTHIKLFIVRT